jgi:hypothetical protein
MRAWRDFGDRVSFEALVEGRYNLCQTALVSLIQLIRFADSSFEGSSI